MLLPHAFEVHHRSFLEKYTGRLERSRENLQTILSMGFKGRIVVEFGWPDLDEAPFGLISEDISRFKKLHKEIIDLII